MTAQRINVLGSSLIHEAWISIGTSRLRTFLAVLGIIIGVGSVVLMIAIGAGSRQTVEAAIDSLGSDLLIVTPGGSNRSARSSEVSALDMDDANLIGQLPSVVSAAPTTYTRSFPITAGHFTTNTQIIGTTPNYFPVRNRAFVQGDSFTNDDVRLLKRVAVLGIATAKKLFPAAMQQGQSIVNSSIEINSTVFRVTGVLEEKGAGFDGRNQDDAVFMPITTARSRLWGQSTMRNMIQAIFVKTQSKETLDEATEDITDFLRHRHKLHEIEDNNFTVKNMLSIMQVASDTSDALSMLLGAIASISLVVGGIGIMNIMLVNVSERTREIGIRKALGATEQQILLQFLLEAVMIAMLGGLLGVILGFGGGIMAKQWISLNVAYSLWSVIVPLLSSAIIGVASGLYPAYKAAKLQPIEALHTPGA